MKVRVQFTAQLRAAVGRAAEDVDLPDGSSVAGLINHLATVLDGARPHLLAPTGQAHRSLLVVVNDEAIGPHQAQAVVLRHGDSVTLMPPIAGG